MCDPGEFSQSNNSLTENCIHDDMAGKCFHKDRKGIPLGSHTGGRMPGGGILGFRFDFVKFKLMPLPVGCSNFKIIPGRLA